MTLGTAVATRPFTWPNDGPTTGSGVFPRAGVGSSEGANESWPSAGTTLASRLGEQLQDRLAGLLEELRDLGLLDDVEPLDEWPMLPHPVITQPITLVAHTVQRSRAPSENVREEW